MRGKRLGAAAAVGLGVAVAVATAAALGVFTHANAASAIGSRADGVQVHGEWTLVVRDKSGNIVSRHSFHNEFLTGDREGPQVFSQILSGQAVAGAWYVQLKTCPVCGGLQLHPFLGNITVTAPTSGADKYKIIIAGTTNAAFSDITVTMVETTLQRCAPGQTPGQECSVLDLYNVTRRTLPSPISVLTGQTVQVTVKISFS